MQILNCGDRITLTLNVAGQMFSWAASKQEGESLETHYSFLAHCYKLGFMVGVKRVSCGLLKTTDSRYLLLDLNHTQESLKRDLSTIEGEHDHKKFWESYLCAREICLAQQIFV